MRLDHYLAAAGVGSRTEVKKIIKKGLVCVGGIVCKDPGMSVDDGNAIVTCRGSVIKYEEYVYFMLNKPQDVISASRADLKNKSQVCVIDLIEDEKHRNLFPVGRLDKDTEGFQLITDDGALAHDLLSPRKHVDKTYYAELREPLSEPDRLHLEAGIDIGDDKPTLPARIEMITASSINITIHEGRYHQIKRMLEAVGNKVTFLKRISMGPLKLDESLAPGEYRRLTADELAALRDRN